MAARATDVDVDGLATEWDQAEDIRQRLRDNGLLIHPETKDKIVVKTTSLNNTVLIPILHRMARLDLGKAAPSPAVEDLREEVKALMDMHKRQTDFKTIDDMAWTVRKFVAFLKLKIRKTDVSQETCLHVASSCLTVC